ncbi:hypothetical protein AOLI_G00036080 [Acnodon oligacanthus]
MLPVDPLAAAVHRPVMPSSSFSCTPPLEQEDLPSFDSANLHIVTLHTPSAESQPSSLVGQSIKLTLASGFFLLLPSTIEPGRLPTPPENHSSRSPISKPHWWPTPICPLGSSSFTAYSLFQNPRGHRKPTPLFSYLWVIGGGWFLRDNKVFQTGVQGALCPTYPLA